MESWNTLFIVNCAGKEFKQEKCDLLYPIMLTEIDRPSYEELFKKVCKHDYDDIVDNYDKAINRFTYNYKLITRPLKETNATTNDDEIINYIIKSWDTYKKDFQVIEDQDLQEGIIKMFLLVTLKKTSSFKRIEKAANLL